LAGIGVISNPHSKLNRKNPNRHHYLTYIAGSEGHVAVTNSLEELEQVASMYKALGVKVIAINGGDGTIAHTITAIIHAWKDQPLPRIVLLRGGTINVVAQNLGIQGTPEEILFRLIEGYSKGTLDKIHRLHTIKIANNYGFLFANGVCANFLEEFYKNKTGRLGSIALILKIFFSRFFNRDFYFKIATSNTTSLWRDGLEISGERRAISTLAATIKQMPLGPKLFPKAGSLGEEIQCVSYVCRPDEIIFKVTKDILFTPNRPSDVKISTSTRLVTIITHPPSGYTLDGELYPPCESVTITLGPEIEFILV
jgi:diacylglycerol kinase (ATP)